MIICIVTGSRFRDRLRLGVVSGIVMSYQFGTNWAVFSDKAGPIIGPLMAYECALSFFLEAGFLGVMLFGIKKVGLSCISSRPAWWRPGRCCRPPGFGGE